jgi:hypothetical protein
MPAIGEAKAAKIQAIDITVPLRQRVRLDKWQPSQTARFLNHAAHHRLSCLWKLYATLYGCSRAQLGRSRRSRRGRRRHRDDHNPGAGGCPVPREVSARRRPAGSASPLGRDTLTPLTQVPAAGWSPSAPRGGGGRASGARLHRPHRPAGASPPGRQSINPGARNVPMPLAVPGPCKIKMAKEPDWASPLVEGLLISWPGAGSNRRPSDFQPSEALPPHAAECYLVPLVLMSARCRPQ